MECNGCYTEIDQHKGRPFDLYDWMVLDDA
jgi:hypothetical protein